MKCRNNTNETKGKVDANKLISNNNEIIKNYFDNNSKITMFTQIIKVVIYILKCQQFKL